MLKYILYSKYDPKTMIAMDRFVQTLSGERKETIERQSLESSATMKEQTITLKRLIVQIQHLDPKLFQG